MHIRAHFKKKTKKLVGEKRDEVQVIQVGQRRDDDDEQEDDVRRTAP